jgi:hypothetical protein
MTATSPDHGDGLGGLGGREGQLKQGEGGEEVEGGGGFVCHLASLRRAPENGFPTLS